MLTTRMKLAAAALVTLAVLVAAILLVNPALCRVVGSGHAGGTNPTHKAVLETAADRPWRTSGTDAGKDAADREEVFRLYAELTKNTPMFRPKLEGIPPFEVNGHEQLLALIKSYEGVLEDFPKEINEMRTGKRPWDQAAVLALLDRHKELLDELVAISRLEHGEYDWNRHSFREIVSKSHVMNMIRLMGLAALAAANDQHGGEALAWMETINRLAGHLQEPKDSFSGLWGLGSRCAIYQLAPKLAKYASGLPEFTTNLDRLLVDSRQSPVNFAADLRQGVVEYGLGGVVANLAGNPDCYAPLKFDDAKKALQLSMEKNAGFIEMAAKAKDFKELEDSNNKWKSGASKPENLQDEALDLFNALGVTPDGTMGSWANSETSRQLARVAVMMVADPSNPARAMEAVATSEPEPRVIRYDPATRTLTAEPILADGEAISVTLP